MPYGQDDQTPPKGGYGQDATTPPKGGYGQDATTSPQVPSSYGRDTQVPMSPAQDPTLYTGPMDKVIPGFSQDMFRYSNDKSLHEQYIKWAASRPQAKLGETSEVGSWLAITGGAVDFDAIAQNLPKYREMAGQFDWEGAKKQHPEFAGYIRENPTIPLTNTGALKGAQFWLTGLPNYGDDPGVDPYPYALAKKVITSDIPEMWHKTGQILNEGAAGLLDLLPADREGSPVARWYHGGAAAEERSAKAAAERGSLDQIGPVEGQKTLYAAKATKMAVEFIPMALAAYAGGEVAALSKARALTGVAEAGLVGEAATVAKAGALTTPEAIQLLSAAHLRGVTIANSVYLLPGLYDRAKEASGGNALLALPLAAGEAALGGKLMSVGLADVFGTRPLAALGLAEKQVFTGALKADSLRGIAGRGVARLGTDWLYGKATMAAQNGFNEAADQLVELSLTGKTPDADALASTIRSGWSDANYMGPIFVFGVGRRFVEEHGRYARAIETGKRLKAMGDFYEADKLAVENPTLYAQMIKTTSKEVGGARYLFLDRALAEEHAKAQGASLRDIVAAAMGDGGVFYDRQVRRGLTDLYIPIEHAGKIGASANFSELIRMEGRFDQRDLSLGEVRRRAEASTQEAGRILKGGLKGFTPEEKLIYQRHLEWLGGDDSGKAGVRPGESNDAKARAVLFSVKAIHGGAKDLTMKEVYEHSFGPGGAYTEAGRASLEERVTAHHNSLTPDQRMRSYYYDPNTGLYNERGYGVRRKQLLDQGVKFIEGDIATEGAKWVNDLAASGHDTGDFLYRAQGVALHRAAKELGIEIGKVGGDFRAILPDHDGKGQERLAQLLARAQEITAAKGFSLTGAASESISKAQAEHLAARKAAENAGTRAKPRTYGPDGKLLEVPPEKPRGVVETDPKKIAFPEDKVDQPIHPDLEKAYGALPAGEALKAYYDPMTGLLSSAGLAASLKPGEHVWSGDLRDLAAMNAASKGLADNAIKMTGAIVEAVTGDMISASHPHGDEFLGSHRDLETLKAVDEEIKQRAATAVVVYHDVEAGKIYMLKGMGFASGIGENSSAAEAALQAFKKTEDGKKGLHEKGSAAGRITVRDATDAEQSAAREAATRRDESARGSGVDAGHDGRGDAAEGEGRDQPQPAEVLATADRATRKAVADSGVLNLSDAVAEHAKSPEEKAALKETRQQALQEAHESLLRAIKAKDRRFLTKEKERITAEVREELKQSPVYNLLHFVTHGETLDGSEERKILFTRADGKPARMLESEIEAYGGKEMVERIRSVNRDLLTKSEDKSLPLDDWSREFGFQKKQSETANGIEMMLSRLGNALPEGEHITRERDARLQSAYNNDLIQNPTALAAAALDGVHTSKTTLAITKMLRVLSQNLDYRRQLRSNMTPEMWRAQAQEILAGGTIKEIKPEAFAKSAGDYARQAQEALAAGKIDKAWDLLDKAALQHWLYRESRVVSKTVAERWESIKREVNSDEWRGALGKVHKSLQDLHDSILAAIGMREGAQPDPAKIDAFLAVVNHPDNGWGSHLAPLWAKDIPEKGPDGKEIPRSPDAPKMAVDRLREILSRTTSFEDLTPQDAKFVYDAIKNIQHIAKKANERRILDQRRSADEIVAAAVEHMSGQPTPDVKLDKDGNPIPLPFVAVDKTQESKWASARRFMEARDANWSEIRVLLKQMGVAEPIFDNFVQARTTFENLQKTIYADYKALWDDNAAQKDRFKVLPGLAEDLGLATKDNLGVNGRYSTPLTKNYLLTMLKWMGTETGRKKLLTSMHLTEHDVLKAAGKYLTRADLEHIQKEHEISEKKLLPLEQEVHMKRYGLELEPAKLMGYAIKFADGTETSYRGGYWPVKWDLSNDQSANQRMAARLGTDAAGRPQTPRGFLESRTNYVGRAPDLNWANYPQHIREVLHDYAFGDFVQEAGRVLLNGTFKQAVADYLSPEKAKQPYAWLQRVALDAADSIPSHLQEQSKWARWARSGIAYSAIGYNGAVAMAHLWHPLAVGAMRDGWGAVHALPAMQEVLAGAFDRMLSGLPNEAVLRAHSNSPVELEHRRSTVESDMRRWYDDLMQKHPGAVGKTADFFRSHAFDHIRIMDEMMSATIFNMTYDRAILHMPKEAAQKKADEAVRSSMPTHDPKEMAALLADKGWLGMNIMFHGYYSKLFQMAREEGAERVLNAREQSAFQKGVSGIEYGARMLAMQTFGVVMGKLMLGHGKEHDEDWSTWLLRNEMAAPFAMLPGWGSGGAAAADLAVTGKMKSSSLLQSPSYALAEAGYRAVRTAMSNRKTGDEKLKYLLNTLLMAGSLPANSPLRAIKYETDLFNNPDSVHNRGIFDNASGWLYGDRGAKQPATPLTMAQDAVSGD
jgi:GGDEF domain-containing protein